MKDVSLIAGVAAAALAAAFLIPSTWSEEAPSTIASGQLLGRDGEPAAGALVTVSVLKADDTGSLVATVVGETRTDADGRWDIDAPDDPVDLGQMEVVALDGDRSVVYDYVASPKSGPTSRTPGVPSSKVRPVELTLQIGVGRVRQARVGRPIPLLKDPSTPDVQGDDGSSGTATGMSAAPDRVVDGPAG